MEKFTINMGYPIYTYHWPARDPGSSSRGVVQLVHGMSEHMARYDEFAAFLNDYGYEVYGHDHPGHGSTGPELGHVPGDAMSHLLGCISAVSDEIRTRHPDQPVFLFGHSLGSYLALRSMEHDPDRWHALILSGPGTGSTGIFKYLSRITDRLNRNGRGLKPGGLLNKMLLQNTRANLLSGSKMLSWRNRDINEVAHFLDDPRSGQEMDEEFMQSLARGISVWYRREELERLRSNLPVLIVSGTGDVVGGFGKGAASLARNLTGRGLTEVYLRLYEGARHDLLWETSKRETMYDILDFLRLAGKEPF